MAVLTGLLVIYWTILLWFGSGLCRQSKSKRNRTPFVSIILAAHNEAQNLGNCLHALSQQDYSQDQFEVIVVNDRSTDATKELLDYWQHSFHQFQTIPIHVTPSGIAPKKFALQKGIEVSSAEILCFTDADCQPPTCWLRHLTAEFGEEVGMVVGLAPLAAAAEVRPPCWQKLLVYESWLNNLLSLAAIRQDFPLSCTGRNLAYRKSAFQQVGGFSAIAHSLSGDDDLFMHLVQKKTSWQITAVDSPAAAVSSKTVSTLRQLWIQRTRHFSAGKHYPIDKKLFYLCWQGTTILLTIAPIVALVIQSHFFLFTIQILIAKWLADFIFHWFAFRRFRQERLLKYFIPFEVIHPFYLLVIGLIGLLKPPKWRVADSVIK